MTTVAAATRVQTKDVHDLQCSTSAHSSDEWTNAPPPKKKNWSGYRQNIHSQKNADGHCKRPFIRKGHETDALKYSRNGIVPLRNEIRVKSKNKGVGGEGKEYLVHDLESTGQPAVIEAAEAAPLWEQLINIYWWRLRNSNMVHYLSVRWLDTKTHCWIAVCTFINDV